jgi:hypothetical protein
MPAKSGRKGRKIGQNKIKCERYRKTRAEPNKVKKITRHLKTNPDDTCASVRLVEIKKDGLFIRGSRKPATKKAA